MPAVERLVETFRAATGISVQFESRLGEQRLSSDVETTLYRVVQEALTNVAKHAAAQSVSVLLVRRGASASAVVEDDGQGFTKTDEAEGGIGLVGDARAARVARRPADHRVGSGHGDDGCCGGAAP